MALHAGCNLTATILAVYCWLGLGEMQMAKTPVIILPDWKVVVASLVLAVAHADATEPGRPDGLPTFATVTDSDNRFNITKNHRT